MYLMIGTYTLIENNNPLSPANNRMAQTPIIPRLNASGAMNDNRNVLSTGCIEGNATRILKNSYLKLDNSF